MYDNKSINNIDELEKGKGEEIWIRVVKYIKVLEYYSKNSIGIWGFFI